MTKATTIKAIYKCLLRDARELQRTPYFALRNTLRLEQWGIGQYVESTRRQQHDDDDDGDARDKLVSIRTLEQFQALQDDGFRYANGVDIVESIRQGFRENIALADSKIIEEKLDEGIRALQHISEQMLLAKCSSVTTTNGVRIEATSQYVQTHSNPEQNIYRFTYRITITNENDDEAIQILGRQYTFESEKGQRIALPRNSPGIVGNTPILAPGQSFEYASGVDINAPRGAVTGCLHAVRRAKNPADAILFDAFVSRFALLAPFALHQ